MTESRRRHNRQAHELPTESNRILNFADKAPRIAE